MATKTYTFRYVFRPVERWFVSALGWLAGGTAGFGCLGFVLALFSMIPAWITHIVVCLKDGEWGFLIGGALFFPIAVIHGWGIWFGWWS